MAHGDYVVDGLTENAILPNRNYTPRTIVDNSLEYIDPTPNVHSLFVQFNVKFFQGKLGGVEVRWSKRMTSCAGTCTFHPSNRSCVIALSAPLLQLRPRKDLVETLLHEMIHGFLFIVGNDRDRDGHGPEFQKHMHRINKEAGTNITIYHTFHDEVRLYQQHWWRCDGPCQKRPPYYGMVRRASNRAPSKNDFWWGEHYRSCGGTFVKVKEPESYTNKKQKSTNPKTTRPTKETGNALSKWFTDATEPKLPSSYPKTPKLFSAPTNDPKPRNFPSSNSSTKNPKPSTIAKGGASSKTAVVRPNNATSSSSTPGITKLGNSINSVHGFGTGGPGSSSSGYSSPTTSGGSTSGISKLGNPTNSVHGWGTGGPGSKSQENSTNSTKGSSGPKFSFSGSLGGSGSGKSNLLDKFANSEIKSSTPVKKKKDKDSPNGKNTLNNYFKKTDEASGVSPMEDRSKKVQCPICSKFVSEAKINDHVDLCLLSGEVEKDETTERRQNDSAPIIIEDDDYTECPICFRRIRLEEIGSHTDRCLDSKAETNPKKRKMDTIEIEDSPPRCNDGSKCDQRCLICNNIINTTLDEHLEDCIGDMFNDETINDEIEKGPEIEKADNKGGKPKFPCPVCMAMIEDVYMNDHLDSCLR